MEDFDICPHDEKLRRLHEAAAEVLVQYGLAGARCELLQYEDNAVYYVLSGRGEQFVLRIGATNAANAVEQASEMQWLDALRNETELRVPEPVCTEAGHFVSDVTPIGAARARHCVLFRWLPGMRPEPGLSRQTMRRIGACTAGLHNHSRQFIAAPGFVRPRWDWARVFGPESPCDTGALLRLTERQQSVLRGVSAEVRQTLEKLSSEPSVEGLIHADLHRDNILLDRNRIGFIDFDDCGFGYYMYDVASLLDSFYRRIANGSEEYSALRDAYLTAYDRVCALPPDVDMQLKCFKAMRDMVNINFILSSRNANVQSWGPARVDATLRQMEVFLAGGPCPGM